MRGNVHKSDSGWVRLQARVNAREGVRAAKMDHRPDWRKIEAERAKKKPAQRRRAVDQVAVDDDGQPFVMRNGRKRRRAYVAHNGR